MAKYQIFEPNNASVPTDAPTLHLSEQQANSDILRQAKVFICGLHISAKTALMHLAESGIEDFAISDATNLGHLAELTSSIPPLSIDELYSTSAHHTANMGGEKEIETVTDERRFADSVREVTDALLRINPNIRVRWFDRQGIQELPRILERYPLVINGLTEDRERIRLYRYAQIHSATIIDHYNAKIPSVFITTHLDPTPEQRFTGINSKNTALQSLSSQFIEQFSLYEKNLVVRELKRLLDKDLYQHSCLSLENALPLHANQALTGSFMATETLKFLLSPHLAASYQGYFVNPINLHRQMVISSSKDKTKKRSLLTLLKSTLPIKIKKKAQNTQHLPLPRRYSKQDITNI